MQITVHDKGLVFVFGLPGYRSGQLSVPYLLEGRKVVAMTSAAGLAGACLRESPQACASVALWETCPRAASTWRRVVCPFFRSSFPPALAKTRLAC